MTVDGEMNRTRDLSRAHWQRSVASVVMSRMADDVIRARTEEPLPGIDEIDHIAHMYRGRRGLGKVWARTFAISGLLHFHPENPYFDMIKNSGVELGFRNHTFTKVPAQALEEGFNTQTFFPVNLAMSIERAAARQQVSGYHMGTLEDVAGMLRRPDFRSLVDESAMTNNGYWGSSSVSITPVLLEANHFVFDESGVRFSEWRSQNIKQSIRKVNQAGAQWEKTLPYQPSSGCPVRHTRPHFTDTAEDQSNLAMLSAHYGVPAEELVAARPQSVIYDALDFTAGALEHYSPILEEVDAREGEYGFR